MKILIDEVIYSKGLSVRQASIYTGIPSSTLHDIINEKAVPRMDTMEQIARGLKVHINDLYESNYK